VLALLLSHLDTLSLYLSLSISLSFLFSRTIQSALAFSHYSHPHFSPLSHSQLRDFVSKGGTLIATDRVVRTVLLGMLPDHFGPAPRVRIPRAVKVVTSKQCVRKSRRMIFHPSVSLSVSLCLSYICLSYHLSLCPYLLHAPSPLFFLLPSLPSLISLPPPSLPSLQRDNRVLQTVRGDEDYPLMWLNPVRSPAFQIDPNLV